MCSLSEVSQLNLFFGMMKVSLSHKYQILIWSGRLMIIYILVGLAT